MVPPMLAKVKYDGKASLLLGLEIDDCLAGILPFHLASNGSPPGPVVQNEGIGRPLNSHEKEDAAAGKMAAVRNWMSSCAPSFRPKGPFTYDFHKILRFLDPPPRHNL